MRYRDGRFEQAYPFELPPPFSPDRQRGATAIARGTRGDILIAPTSGPLRYSGGKFTPVVSSGSAGGLAIPIAETADGTVWIGMRDTGLFRVRAGNASPVTGLPDQKVNALLPGTGSELWIGTDSGSGALGWRRCNAPRRSCPTRAHPDSRPRARSRFQRLDLYSGRSWPPYSCGSAIEATTPGAPGTVRAIYEDREGNLWFGGTQGLMQLRDTPFLTYAVAARDGGSVYVDASGRAWMAPSSGGLFWIRGRAPCCARSQPGKAHS